MTTWSRSVGEHHGTLVVPETSAVRTRKSAQLAAAADLVLPVVLERGG